MVNDMKIKKRLIYQLNSGKFPFITNCLNLNVKNNQYCFLVNISMISHVE